MGLPVVHGESAHEGGYHYYPRIEQVKEWLHQAHFRQIDETVGDFYHHFIVQKDLLTFSHDYKSARESSFVANRLK